MLPFFLAHHPDCENLKEHTLKAGRYRFCIGCFIGYPTAVIGIILIDFIGLIEIFSVQLFFILGISFLSLIILSILNLTKFKLIKIIQKIFIGIGGSFLFWGIYLLPNPKIYNLFLIFLVFSTISSLLNFYHVFSIYKECKACENCFNWNKCPGFESIRYNLQKYHLNNFFDFFEEISDNIKQRKETKEI